MSIWQEHWGANIWAKSDPKGTNKSSAQVGSTQVDLVHRERPRTGVVKAGECVVARAEQAGECQDGALGINDVCGRVGGWIGNLERFKLLVAGEHPAYQQLG